MSTIASHSPLNISEAVSDRPRGLVVWFQRTINRMARCHCRLTSLRSVKVSNQLRRLRQAVRSLCEDASKTLVRAFVSCCLDYCIYVFSVEPVAVGSECCRLSGYWYSTFRHDAVAVSYTGYRYASASTSSLRRSFIGRSFIGRCLAFHHRNDRT